MRNPALLLVATFAVACASSPTPTIPGRHALLMERTSMSGAATEPFELQIEAALAKRLQSVTRVSSVEEGAGYDDVIVIKWGTSIALR